jgi:hypothetical protein
LAGIAWSSTWERTGWNRPVDLATPEPGCVHQQDHIGGRGRALCLQAGQDAGVVGVHAVELDAGRLGEVGVQRLVRGIVAGGVDVEYGVLRQSELMIKQRITPV